MKIIVYFMYLNYVNNALVVNYCFKKEFFQELKLFLAIVLCLKKVNLKKWEREREKKWQKLACIKIFKNKLDVFFRRFSFQEISRMTKKSVSIRESFTIVEETVRLC